MQIHELPSGTPTEEDLIPFDTGQANYKTPFSGFDVGENTATFTSADEADPAQFKTVGTVESGPIKTILNKLSMAVSNIRYIWKVLSALAANTENYTYNGSTSKSFKIDSGEGYFYMNQAEGYFNLTLDDATHRVLVHKGNASNHEAGLLMVGDSWFRADRTDQYISMRYNGTRYITVNDSTKRIYLNNGDTKLYLDDTEKRVYITASGGLYVNGTRVGS